jgi:hypothetical protein
MKKRNPVKKNMDKFHKPRTHRDKTKYDRRTESEKMQDELEPIIHGWESEGGAVHPTEHDESDEIEELKKIEDDLRDANVLDDEYRKLNKIIP